MDMVRAKAIIAAIKFNRPDDLTPSLMRSAEFNRLLAVGVLSPYVEDGAQGYELAPDWPEILSDLETWESIRAGVHASDLPELERRAKKLQREISSRVRLLGWLNIAITDKKVAQIRESIQPGLDTARAIAQGDKNERK